MLQVGINLLVVGSLSGNGRCAILVCTEEAGRREQGQVRENMLGGANLLSLCLKTAESTIVA